MSGAGPLVVVEGLRKHFQIGGSWLQVGKVVKAVDDVSFTVGRKRIVGLVGESGSGKTTIGRTLLRLVEPTAGTVLFDGIDVNALPLAKLRRLRARMQIIFQDPYSSLNPRMTVGEILAEALTAQSSLPRAQQRDRSAAMLDRVGLPPEALRRYPHEFSGGQRQRIGIARALAVGPDFLVADEAVSALDVSVQAQVLTLLQDLQAELGLAILFIAHDLAVVDHLCDEVVVLYLGRVMEAGPTDAVIGSPAHPYTRALLSAVPVPDPDALRERVVLQGDVPSPLDAPSGCVFRTRCPVALPRCAEPLPPPRQLGNHHLSACIREDLP